MRAGLLLLFLLTACRSQPSEGAKPATLPACQAQMFEQSRFTVCDPGKGRIELFAAAKAEAPTRQLADLELSLGNRAAGVAFAMNGGMVTVLISA